jgi:hypothetical protein
LPAPTTIARHADAEFARGLTVVLGVFYHVVASFEFDHSNAAQKSVKPDLKRRSGTNISPQKSDQ